MTPKEKAKKLVDKFYNIDSDSKMFDDFNMPIFYAQRCALKLVNEMIEESSFADGYYNRQNFWQEVKKEIEKL